MRGLYGILSRSPATAARAGTVKKAAAQADTAGGATLATLVADHNALLAKLRAAGIMA